MGIINGRNIFFIICLATLAGTTITSYAQYPNTTFSRKYKKGDIYRYRLITQSSFNGKLTGKTISVCELKVVDSAGVAFDEVRWISKHYITEKDTVDASEQAAQVKPYRISLHPKGTVDIPKIEVASMTGEITDFNTFIVAISPKMDVNALQKKGDRFRKKDVVKGDFANGKDILKGTDCLQVSMAFMDEDKQQVKLFTTFQPPADSCLAYLLDEMRTPVVKDTINNFQMVRDMNGAYGVFYGREFFDINTSVAKKDGKIMQATMYNLLSLKIKQHCDYEYKNCRLEIPGTIKRELTLELLP